MSVFEAMPSPLQPCHPLGTVASRRPGRGDTQDLVSRKLSGEAGLRGWACQAAMLFVAAKALARWQCLCELSWLVLWMLRLNALPQALQDVRGPLKQCRGTIPSVPRELLI